MDATSRTHHFPSPGIGLREDQALSATGIDCAMLPKYIGGDAVSIDEDGKEDEHCSRGFEHKTLSEWITSLEAGGPRNASWRALPVTWSQQLSSGK